MNRILFLFAILFASTSSLECQVLEPVKWDFKVIDQGEGLFDVVFHADIEEKWHVYAMDLGDKIGPIPTSFTFEMSPSYDLVGEIKGEDPIVHFDPMFEMEIGYYEESATWTQRIKATGSAPFQFNGVLEYMSCDEGQCIFPDPVEIDLKVVPPSNMAASASSAIAQVDSEPELEENVIAEDAQHNSGILEPVEWTWLAEKVSDDEYYLVFNAKMDEGWHVYSAYLDTTKIGPVPTSVTIEKNAGASLVGTLVEEEPTVKYDPNFDMELKYFGDEAEFIQRVKTDKDMVSGYVSFMTCNDEMCLPPEDLEFSLDLSKASATSRASDIGLDKTEGSSGASDEEEGSLWGIFILAFFSGFAALLTPCVFPMIPLTVSFFTKQSKTKAKGISNAILYGVSIIVLYVALGVGVSAVFGADVMHQMATDPWFNLFFFVLLVVFAASFLGAFEITLPNSWVNKADSASNKGGLLGIFFMAFTLALVSFSCTGPIVGTLLVKAAQGGYMGPIIGMLGFSSAIALPFALFAAFPGWLNSLPQSGGWLNSVKVVLGFLELALAFKFLSNADLVLQWHLLEREAFIALWVIIFGLLTMYLLGFLKLSHDSPLPHISVTRLFMAIVTGAFTIYMIPGLWGAPLKLINAFPPPMFYSESPEGVGHIGSSGPSIEHSDSSHPDGTHKGPGGIYVFHDYDQGLAYAKSQGLPVMLDFTGWACVNCRKMEENVWVDSEIKRMLSEELVLISLYVDERLDLPESEHTEVELNGKTRKIRRVGDKWKVMQEQRYGTNSQPYYVLIDHDEENLIEAANYQDHGSIPVFKEWLTRGLSKFKQ